jgi:1,4-dihydroxy-6-naphthoate synthase
VRLRIGISPCPNDVFLYAGLILNQVPWPDGAWEFDFQDLETLNQSAQQGYYDVVKISFANLPRCIQHYRLLHCGGALGRGCGPLLLTGGNAFDLEREILIPGEATTAHVLLQAYAAAQWPKRLLLKKFLPFHVIYSQLMGDRGAQGVVIHEQRFTYERDGMRLVRDLGSHWEAATGSPIPLGALVLARNLNVTAGSVEAAVRASLQWAYEHRREALDLCREHAQDMDNAVMQSHIDLYVNAFSRELGMEGEAAVKTFFDHLGFTGNPY